MAPHPYRTPLQVFTAHTQRTRQDGAFFVGDGSGVQIRLSRVVPDEPSLSLFMAIAKWEQSVGCFPGSGWKTGDRHLGQCRTKHEPITTELAGSPETHLFASPDLSHSHLKTFFHSYSSKSSAYLHWFFSQTPRKQGIA